MKGYTYIHGIMGLDVDYVFAKNAIDELEKLLSDQPYGKRKAIAGDIILLVNELKAKYSQEKYKGESWNPDWQGDSDDPNRWNGW
jgi:hypothetical protein